MAASQARLLTITARLHDVEYKAQSIQNAKIQLATQSDQVYKEYLKALDETTLTVKDANGNTIQANFNNLFGKNAVDTASGNKYALRNTNGLLIVEDDVKDAYDRFVNDGGYDPFEFALMLIGDDGGNSLDADSLAEDEEEVFQNHASDGSDDVKSMINIREKMDNLLAENNATDYNELPDDVKDQYIDLENRYKFKLYKNFASEIYAKNTGYDEEDFNQEDFQYYVNIFKQIQAAGGCVSIHSRKFDGPSGDASSDSEWLQRMIQSGQFIIDIVTQDKNGVISFASTAPSSDSNISYTTTTQIDKSALAKAEAEYEHKTKQIDQKDKKFDMDLSKLETERTALTTEYESVKKVISDNIERTFGIFS